jgi:hypothetical protein
MTTTRLTVIEDEKGEIIATAFSLEAHGQANAPRLRMMPSSLRHRLREIDVPSSFRELSAAELHQHVQVLLSPGHQLGAKGQAIALGDPPSKGPLPPEWKEALGEMLLDATTLS